MSDSQAGPAEDLPPILPQVALIFLLVLVSYFPAFSNQFTYDSGIFFFGNPAVHAHYTLGDVFSLGNYSGRTGVMSWRPIPLLSFLLFEGWLFARSAALSHGLNLLIHGSSAVMLLLFVRFRFPAYALCAPLAAMIFAVHPLASETVYCSGFRFDQMAVLFGLASLVPSPASSRLWVRCLGPIFFAAAILSKESAVALIPVHAFLIIRDTGFTRRAASWIAIYLSIFISFFMAWLQFRYEDYPSTFLGGGGRLLGMANFCIIFVTIYFPRFFAAGPLRVDHDYVAAESFGSALMVACLVIVLVIGATSIPVLRRGGIFAAAWLLLFLPFGTVSQVVPIPDPVAERFCYMPLAGFSILAAIPLSMAVTRGRTGLYVVLGMLLLYSSITRWRGAEWRDDVTLNIANWESFRSPSDRGLESLGGLHIRRAASAPPEVALESITAASTALKQLTDRSPANPSAWRLRTVAAIMARKPDEARLHLLRYEALTSDPAFRISLGDRLP